MSTANANVGTWKLNAARSKFHSHQPAVKEATLVVQAVSNQIEVAVTATMTDGSPIVAKYTYPKEGGIGQWVGPVPVFAADHTTVITVVNPTEVYYTILKDGKQHELRHNVISKDGKTIRVTVKSKDSHGKLVESLAVWEKQRSRAARSTVA